jgi:hypothetical protein
MPEFLGKMHKKFLENFKEKGIISESIKKRVLFFKLKNEEDIVPF